MLVGLGELAGLATAVSWALSSHIHTVVGRRVGAAGVIVIRAPLFVTAMFLVAFLFGADTTTPLNALVFLVCSALAGLVVADAAFYAACISIGPRLAVLIQSSFSSCITTGLGWVLLGEHIGSAGVAGIGIIILGVAFVLLEGGVPAASAGISGEAGRERFRRGIALAFAAASALALSYFCLKQGLRRGVDPLWAAAIRVSVGCAFLWTGMAVRGRLFAVMRQGWSTKGVPLMLIYGCVISTVGNCLAVVAMYHVESGVVAALIGLQPVVIIPIVALAERKYPTGRAVVGAVAAFAGMTVLFFR